MSCVACTIARTPKTAQKIVRFLVADTPATTNIPRPSRSCIATTQVRFFPNRSTTGLNRTLKVTARCSQEVEEICVFEAPIAVRNSVAIWCRKLHGNPSPK